MNSEGKSTLFFVDDHPLVAQGISLQLENDKQLTVCGTATGYQEAIEKIEAMQPDIVIADLSLEDGNGLTLVRELKPKQPSISFIILSSHSEIAFANRSIRAGARGYIMKNLPFPQIIDGIRTVANGEILLSEKVKKHLIEQMTNTGSSFSNALAIDELSDREFEIFHLTGEGYRPRQIAEKLNLSTRTINTHYQNIRSKLQLENMDELVNLSLVFFK